MTACVMKEAVPPCLTFSFSGLLVISSSPGVGDGIGVGETEGSGVGSGEGSGEGHDMGSLVVETLTGGVAVCSGLAEGSPPPVANAEGAAIINKAARTEHIAFLMFM